MAKTAIRKQKPGGQAHETIVEVSDTDLLEQMRAVRSKAEHDTASAYAYGAENTQRERLRAEKAEAELAALCAEVTRAQAAEKVAEGLWKAAWMRCTCGGVGGLTK
jgi:hypothetical protein